MHVIQKNYLILLILTLGASLATQAADHRLQLSPEDQRLLGNQRAQLYMQALANPEKNFPKLYKACKKGDKLQNAVYCATKNGHIEIINQFLKKTPIHKIRHDDRSTPLHVAAKYDQPDVVAALLNANADTSLTSRSGANPLRIAVEGNSIEIARQLLDADKARQVADANYDVNKYPVCAAIPADHSTALHVATQLGYEKMSELLVLFKADIHAKAIAGNTPLFIAAQHGHANLAKYFIGLKADPNAVNVDAVSPLRLAVQNKYATIVKALLDAKADPNVKLKRDKSSCLHVVAEQGDIQTAQLLLTAEVKADVNALMQGKETPLHRAAIKGLSDMITFLLANGANPTITNDNRLEPHLLVFAQGFANSHDNQMGSQMNAQMIEILEAMPKLLTPENPAPLYVLHDIADAIMRLDSDADASLIYRCHELIKTFLATGLVNPDNVDRFGNTYLDILNGTTTCKIDSEPEAQEEPEQKQKTAEPSRTPSPDNLALPVQLEQASRKARNKEEQLRIAREQAIIEQIRAQRAKEAKATIGKKQTVAPNQAKAPAAPIAPKKPALEQKQGPAVEKKQKLTRKEIKNLKKAAALHVRQEAERQAIKKTIEDMHQRIDAEKAEDQKAEDADDLFAAVGAEQEQLALENEQAEQEAERQAIEIVQAQFHAIVANYLRERNAEVDSAWGPA